MYERKVCEVLKIFKLIMLTKKYKILRILNRDSNVMQINGNPWNLVFMKMEIY